MIRIYTLLILLCLPLKSLGQETISDYLLTAFEDPEVTSFDAQKDFMRPENFRLPVIDELELRIGNDELLYEDLQYQVRIRPSNPWLIRRNNAFFNATRLQLSARKQLEFKEALKDRYETALSFLSNSKQLSLAKEQLKLADQLTSVFEDYPESDLFDANDFVDAKLNMVDEIGQVNEEMLRVDRTGRLISLTLGNSDFDWADFKLISIEVIDSLSNQIIHSRYTPADLNYIASQIEVARQEVRKEKADFDIGFIQGEYFPFTNRDSEFGFAAGINIPIFRKNKPQIAERRLDEIELKNDLLAQEYRDSVNKVLEFEYLKSVIAQHRLLEGEIEKLGLSELQKDLNRSRDFDPVTAIELEMATLKLRKMIIESRFRVIEQFIDFIFSFDIPNQQPLINYLSQNLDRIK